MPDLTTVILPIIAAFAGGIVAGLLGSRRWSRDREAGRGQADSDLSGLVEKTASLDGQVGNIHTMMAELLREQAGAGQTLALTHERTTELHQVLANPKQRGDWGEVLAEDVLLYAGLQHQLNYVRQRKMPYGRGRPDFTFTMPDGLELHLDSKFPLENFRRMEQADTDDDREDARAAFVNDIKRHIKGLTDRGYADPEHTVGFAVLFFANRGIFDAVVEADPDILKFALSHNVTLSCPQTLASVLIIVRNAANSFRVQRRTRDVLRCVQGFQAEWQKFVAHVAKADKQLSTFVGSWESLKGTRRNQLQKRLDRIDELDTPDNSIDELPASTLPAVAVPEEHRPEHSQAA